MGYRVVLLGSGGVGKTAIVNRFVGEGFSTDYHPTVDDIYRHIVRMPGKLNLRYIYQYSLSETIFYIIANYHCMIYLLRHAVFISPKLIIAYLCRLGTLPRRLKYSSFGILPRISYHEEHSKF